MKNLFLLTAAAFVMTACATLSPQARIENRLVELGFSRDRARCMGNELDDRLDRRDLNAVADFIGDLNAAGSPGQTLDAILRIDNGRAAAAIAASGVACAFR